MTERIKVLVKKLQSKSSPLSADYSKTIEEFINNRDTIADTEGNIYDLKDYSISKIEDNWYVILRFARFEK